MVCTSFIVALAAAALAGSAVIDAAIPPSSPLVFINIVFDDLGWSNVGWNSPNPPENETPRLAALAASGVHLLRQINHYTCTPSRSSLNSGRLPVHVQTTLDNPDVQTAGVPVNMTTLPRKMAQAGYDAVIAGKWDMGFARAEHTPEGRGYNKSLIYATHMNNYWSQRLEVTGTDCPDGPEKIYDLWEDGAPAVLLAGRDTFIEDMFLNKTLGALADFDPASGRGLFLDYRPHSLHWPLMVPEAAFENFSWVGDDEGACRMRFYGDPVWPGGSNGTGDYACRRQFQAMLSLADAKVGAIEDAIRARGFWNRTLVTFMSDNGGSQTLSENAANNWPRRCVVGARF